MIEYQIINSFLNKEIYNNYHRFYNLDYVKKHYPIVYKIQQTLKLLWNTTTADSVSLQDVEAMFFASYPVLKEAERTEIGKTFQDIALAGCSEVVKSLLEQHRNRSIAADCSIMALDVAEGREDALKLVEMVSAIGVQNHIEEEQHSFITDDLAELKHETISKPGLRWRLPAMNKMLGSLRKGDFGFLFARPECLAKGTPVILHDGRTVPVEKLRAGMEVMGKDSNPRKILATTVGRAQMYEICYPWGESFTVNGNHVLHLECWDGRVVNMPVVEYIKQSNKFKHDFKQIKVPIELPEKDLKLDPYILGLWLGDGTSSSPSFTNMDAVVISSIAEWAGTQDLLCNIFERENQGKAKTIYIASKTKKHGANTFLQFLRSSRLLNNKHIPDRYLRSSSGQRLQLLAGLLDTDGSRGRHGYEITQVREALAHQILWLARSLGFHAILSPKIVKETTYYRVSIYGDVYKIPVRIKYKQFKKGTAKKKQNLRFGFTVTATEIDDYYGIYVDKDNLYVLGDFTVTHNTGKTTFLASEVTYMAEQAQTPVVWFNNEEQGNKVMVRCYQATLGLNLTELFSDIDKNTENYYNKIRGRLKIYDAGTIHRKQVEDVCKQLNPSLIIFDQIDKIKGWKEDRHDLVMKDIYQWARELAKTYGPVIGVCQAGGSGEGKKFLTMDDVDSSKTAKQGEADWILGIGKSHNDGEEFVRYLHLSKNKLSGDEDTIPDLRHGKESVIIRPDIARYN